MSLVRNIRDIFIRLAAWSGAGVLYRRHIKRKGPLVKVLVFHDVTDAAWFDALIARLVREYRIITPEAFRNGTFEKDAVNVLVTFDDGYASWVDTCLPVLDAHGVKALFFINSGLLDAAGDSEKTERYLRENLLIGSRATLSWEGARTLLLRGHTIGGHTVHHARLAQLGQEEQRREITDDRRRIETVLGVLPREFAYPFGGTRDYTDMTKMLVKDAGYERAFITSGRFTDVRDPFSLSRMCVENRLTPDSLILWVEGNYDLYRTLKELCVR